MEYKVEEVLFTDMQMKSSLEKVLNGLSVEGFVVHSIHTTFNSVIVVAYKLEGTEIPGQECYK
jgi:hypothetical protein